jgi:hypothetical protein
MREHRQKILRRIRNLGILLICSVLLSGIYSPRAEAEGLFSEDPQRVATLNVTYTTYEWWLLSWQNSQVVCQVYVEHEGWPDASEVLYYCGSSIQNQWLRTQPCLFSDKITNSKQCSGLYLHLASVTPGEREVEVILPESEVFVSVSDCNPVAPENHCSTIPKLHLEGFEPLPNEQIIQIQGYVDGVPFSCPGSVCDLPIPPTGQNGVLFEFWADSSYGDSSEVFKAQVRLIPWGDFMSPEESPQDATVYYVDVISSQWRGSAISSCSQVWSSFTPVGGPPSWLESPEFVEDLVTKNKYYFLAGSLISQGLVDASTCANNGMEASGAANECGMELARPLVNEWQNQFDTEILRVAGDTGIPAQLMKNIFSRESQFWPGIYARVSEAGLGHLSDLGADTVLLWNPSFFSQFCPLVLSTETCQRGFGNLDLSEQEMLRGALVQKVNAACSDCPMGIDLAQANFSISIFARSLLANCEQVGQVLYNNTGRPAGEVASYEDLWRFTLVNYNAGSGCLTNALQRTINAKLPLTWQNVSGNLEDICQGGVAYVDEISSMPPAEEPVVATVLPTLAPPINPTLKPTATPTRTPSPTLTKQPTTTKTITATPTKTRTPTPSNTP